MKAHENNVIENLREEVVIPKVVEDKKEAAFHAIRTGQARGPVSEKIQLYQPKKRARRRPAKRVFVAAAAAALAVGAVTVGAAAYMQWSRSMAEGLRVTEEQKKVMEETKMTSEVGQSVTREGITVTLEQTIVDNYFAYIAFRVEGYEVEQGVQPEFETYKVLVDGHEGLLEDGTDYFAATGLFYDGLVSSADGSTVEKPDGSAPDLDENGYIISNYVAEDGSMEYLLTLDGHGNKGQFLDKPLHVELSNLGSVAKAEYFPDVEATWSFDCTLTGSDEMKELDVELPVEDTGVTIKHVDLSPVSVYAEMETAAGVEPPELTGVKLKDGSFYPICWYEPGVRGFIDDTTYRINFSFDRIFDTDEIAALVLRRPLETSSEENQTLTEEDFYVVPLEG